MIGGLFDNSGKEVSRQMQQIADMYAGINLPEIKDVDFNPEMMDYQLAKENPMVLMQQMAALEKMQGLADEGLTAQDTMMMDRSRSDAGQRARQATQAAMQNANARGVGGSGMEFAMREMGNQSAAEMNRRQGMEQAMQSAQNRALNQHAYSQGLGNLRNQDLAVKQANTGVINQFNQMNTQNRNQANLRNIDQQRNNAQQRYQNQVTRADGMAGAKRGIADAAAARGAQQAGAVDGLIQTGLLAGGLWAKCDERLKTKIRNASDVLTETFDSLSPYLWEYKNSDHGEGEYVGVMAQDLEKTPAGRLLVHNTPEGKMVDVQAMVPMLMAGMAMQQKRINELEAKLGKY